MIINKFSLAKSTTAQIVNAVVLVVLALTSMQTFSQDSRYNNFRHPSLKVAQTLEKEQRKEVKMLLLADDGEYSIRQEIKLVKKAIRKLKQDPDFTASENQKDKVKTALRIMYTRYMAAMTSKNMIVQESDPFLHRLSNVQVLLNTLIYEKDIQARNSDLTLLDSALSDNNIAL